MASIFDNMPNYQSFRDNQNVNNAPPEPTSIYNNRTPFSNPVTYNPSDNADPSLAYSGSGPVNAGTGWNSLIDNPFIHGVGSVYDYGKGVLSGVGNALTGNNQAQPQGGMMDKLHDTANQFLHPTQFLQHNWDALKNIPSAIAQGFTDPNQATQNFEHGVQNDANTMPSIPGGDPFSSVASGAMKYGIGAMNDPLLYLPIGKALQGVKWVSDAAGATPYIAKAADAVANAPLIKPAIQGTKDMLGKAFVKNYGASPDINSILKSADGEKAFHQVNNLDALKGLQQGHGLTPDQLNELGHITEKTLQGTPGQQALAQQLSDLLENGAPRSDIGSKLMSQTASAVNGEPLLAAKIDNYFPHIYNNVPDELKGVFPRKVDGVGGLSANGTYNLPRTFSTLQDAMQQGLKPEMNPFLATGQRLNEMSKAYTNNSIIDKIKNTSGLLFDKDPIDEVSKLIKTGRMTTDQAAQQLGMSVEDMKKGFVQSQIPQLKGAYIRPADEAALTEYLNPSRPTGVFSVFNKANNLYNKGFLMNPLPHLHNVTMNGVGLGGAKTSYISEALKGGVTDPWYQQALKAGAVNNPVEGSFTKAITKQDPTNIVSKGFKASHDLLWNTDASIRTALFRDAVESGATAEEAAAKTNKFMVNYNDLTPFEKKYMKAVVPFYSWKKGNIPLQVSQTIAQTPKYAAWNHAKDAVSQELSGQPTDQKGRIQTDENLPDGSHVAIDPYNPMDEPAKIAEKGIIPWALGSVNPIVREAQAQGSSLLGAYVPNLGIQSKYPIYNAGAPGDYNARKGIAHAINGLNPFSGSVIGGEIGNSSNGVNRVINGISDLFGGSPSNDLPTKDKPGQTTSELITKLFGGFTGRDNPAKDTKNEKYQQKDDLKGQIKYLKETGQQVPRSLTRDAYKKVK